MGSPRHNYCNIHSFLINDFILIIDRLCNIMVRQINIHSFIVSKKEAGSPVLYFLKV